MTLDEIFVVFERAHDLTGHRDFVVIGSLSILGMDDETSVPADMSMSIDIDCYTRVDPGRIVDVKGALGELSPFHVSMGYYLDPVSPALPTLPGGWEARMHKVERSGLSVWFLEPNDAAISKYARGEPKDLRWIRAGILSGLVSLPMVRTRLKTTVFIDADEERLVRTQVEADTSWIKVLHARQARSALRRKP